MYKNALVIFEVGEGTHQDQLDPRREKSRRQNAQIVEKMFSANKGKWLENP